MSQYFYQPPTTILNKDVRSPDQLLDPYRARARTPTIDDMCHPKWQEKWHWTMPKNWEISMRYKTIRHKMLVVNGREFYIDEC